MIEYDELMTTPNTETDFTLVFNKISKVLLASIHGVNQEINELYCISKTVSYNPTTHTWHGDYDTGSVISIEASPKIIEETLLDDLAGDKIKKEFEYYHQLNVLFDVVSDLVTNTNLTGVNADKFNSVKEYIDDIRETNGRFKDSYIADENWEYISKEDAKILEDKQFAGGLSEIVKENGDN